MTVEIYGYDVSMLHLTLSEGSELIYNDLFGVLNLPQYKDFFKTSLIDFRVGDVVKYSLYQLTISEIGKGYVKLKDLKGSERQYSEGVFLKYVGDIIKYA